MLKSAGRRLTVLLAQIKPFPLSQKRRLSDLSYHSEPLRFVNSTMRVRLIPALQDNYMYLLVDDATKTCAAVDPVEPQKIVAAVKEEGVNLTTVLTTHHHWDHANGNEEIAGLVPDLAVYGGDERIKALTKLVKHGDQFKVGELSVKCLFTPCHTTGHICYFVTGPNSGDPLVFTGDTLFQGGCGRFFEGSPEQMHHALNEILAKLPENTDVYCGHEYTVNNLKYALHVEPNNTDVQERLTWAQSQRNKNVPTIPSKIAGELKFNPFMRVDQPSVQQHTGQKDPISVMGALRKEKDTFKPKK